MTAQHTPGRVALPYKVRIVGAPHGSPTYFRNGTFANVTNRYFATFEEAVRFCGSARRVIHAPGEAFRAAIAKATGSDQ